MNSQIPPELEKLNDFLFCSTKYDVVPSHKLDQSIINVAETHLKKRRQRKQIWISTIIASGIAAGFLITMPFLFVQDEIHSTSDTLVTQNLDCSDFDTKFNQNFLEFNKDDLLLLQLNSTLFEVYCDLYANSYFLVSL